MDCKVLTDDKSHDNEVLCKIWYFLSKHEQVTYDMCTIYSFIDCGEDTTLLMTKVGVSIDVSVHLYT